MKAILALLLLAVAAESAGQTPTIPASQQWALERTQLVKRIVDLEEQLASLQIQIAKQKIAAEQARLVAEVEAANPGFTWDLATGTLVEKPKE
jgi:hypothetical protein